jgi:5-methyltetrahydrofolate--homocysteine methyltransferase
MPAKIVDLMANMREKEALEMARGLLESGEDPVTVLNWSKEAMDIVGKRFAKGEYFLPELMMAGEMMRQISEMVKPLLKSGTETKRLGKVIIGTVAGDIHDIGKDIVVFMLDVNGFEVIDLGIDAPVERFVSALEKHHAPVVGLSGFLTLAFDSMKSTVEAISKAGLRENTKIMIGGGQIDEEIRKYTGADEFGMDAMDAVRLAMKWIGGQRQ